MTLVEFLKEYTEFNYEEYLKMSEEEQSSIYSLYKMCLVSH